MAYGTVSSLKLRLAATGSGDDTVLGEILDSATLMVDEITGHSWGDGAATRSYGAADALISLDGRTLFLDAPLSAITTLTNGDSTVIASGEYVLLPRNETLKWRIWLDTQSGYLWTFNDGDGVISINGTWVVPANVKEATYLIAEALYRRNEEGALQIDAALEGARKLLGAQISIGAL